MTDVSMDDASPKTKTNERHLSGYVKLHSCSFKTIGVHLDELKGIKFMLVDLLAHPSRILDIHNIPILKLVIKVTIEILLINVTTKRIVIITILGNSTSSQGGRNTMFVKIE